MKIHEIPDEALPGQLWIGRLGISETYNIFQNEKEALEWMEYAGSHARLWNVCLCDSVEMVLIPATHAHLEQKNFTP